MAVKKAIRSRGRPKSAVKSTKVTYNLPTVLINKVSDMAYWERVPASTVVAEALINFFAGKNVKSRPSKPTLKDKAKAMGIKL